MIGPTLVLGAGVLPDGAVFDLSASVEAGLSVPVWDPSSARARRGDMWLDYPFKAGFQGIGGENAAGDSPATHRLQECPEDQQLAQQTRGLIEAGIAAIIEQGEALGFHSARTWRILTELLQNATAYGALSETINCAGLVRLAWEFNDTPGGPTLTVAVSNPIPRLFNPARYCNIPFEQYCSIAEQGGSGHVAVSLFVGFLTEGQKLHYLWDMPDGYRVVCRLGRCAAGESEADTDEILMNPARIGVSKYDKHDREVPYSLYDFLHDIDAGVPAEAVTVAGIFARE